MAKSKHERLCVGVVYDMHSEIDVAREPRLSSNSQCQTADQCVRSGDQTLYELLTLFGRDYIIRFRGRIHVEHAARSTNPPASWSAPGHPLRRCIQGHPHRDSPVLKVRFGERRLLASSV